MQAYQTNSSEWFVLQRIAGKKCRELDEDNQSQTSTICQKKLLASCNKDVAANY